jgi:hypothetical protein
MPGFSSYDDIINEITTNDKQLEYEFYKNGPAATAGQWMSLWYGTGCPGAGADPAGTPGAALTNEAGSINFVNRAPDQKHLLTFGSVSALAMSVRIYDRLVGVGGVALTGVADVPVNSAALTRYTGGAGVEVWLEITTATSVAAPQVHMQYVDELGVARVSPNMIFPLAITLQRTMLRMPILAPSNGVRSVTSLDVTVAGATGICNVVLLKPLATIPVLAYIWNERDLVLQMSSLPRIYDGASLALMFVASVVTAPVVYGSMKAGYG